jgi:hypothetical protein
MENVGIFYGRLVWFVAIRYVFPVLVSLDQEKFVNPGTYIPMNVCTNAVLGTYKSVKQDCSENTTYNALSIHMSSLVNLFMKELCRFETKL